MRTASFVQLPQIAVSELPLDQTPAPWTLTASDGSGLVATRVEAKAVTQGPLAFTELHLYFTNVEDRIREGTFAITLPANAAVSRFAMETNGQWMEAEVVEKQVARRAYEDFLHRKQDPALMEKAAGNQFTARVFPIEANSGSRVTAGDFDGDGDQDLFVGSRSVPWSYGLNPVSMLLRNDGRGHFTDVTDAVAPQLAKVGMVTDAVWQDVDGDRRLDLVVVGEWMPITVFRNTGGRLVPTAVRGLEQSAGWWNRIIAGDFNGDGKMDFIVGNLGLNSRMRASPKEPATMFVKDFDGNGQVDQIVACYNQGRSYPLVLRDEMIKALPPLKVRFLSYTEYARAGVTDIFKPADLTDALQKTVETFATSMMRNNGDGSFTLVPLPDEAQLAPVYGIAARDIDGDGITDLLLAGNFDGVKPDIARLSDSYGTMLRGAADGSFTVVRRAGSGFFAPGQSREILQLRSKDGARVVVARNNARPLVFRLNRRDP